MSGHTSIFPVSKPTVASVLQSFGGVLGIAQAERVLSDAAAQTGLTLDGNLDVEDLHRIAAFLSTQPGLPSVLGIALQIRCDTYLTLTKGLE